MKHNKEGRGRPNLTWEALSAFRILISGYGWSSVSTDAEPTDMDAGYTVPFLYKGFEHPRIFVSNPQWMEISFQTFVRDQVPLFLLPSSPKTHGRSQLNGNFDQIFMQVFLPSLA